MSTQATLFNTLSPEILWQILGSLTLSDIVRLGNASQRLRELVMQSAYPWRRLYKGQFGKGDFEEQWLLWAVRHLPSAVADTLGIEYPVTNACLGLLDAWTWRYLASVRWAAERNWRTGQPSPAIACSHPLAPTASLTSIGRINPSFGTTTFKPPIVETVISYPYPPTLVWTHAIGNDVPVDIDRDPFRNLKCGQHKRDFFGPTWAGEEYVLTLERMPTKAGRYQRMVNSLLVWPIEMIEKRDAMPAQSRRQRPRAHMAVYIPACYNAATDVRGSWAIMRDTSTAADDTAPTHLKYLLFDLYRGRLAASLLLESNVNIILGNTSRERADLYLSHTVARPDSAPSSAHPNSPSATYDYHWEIRQIHAPHGDTAYQPDPKWCTAEADPNATIGAHARPSVAALTSQQFDDWCADGYSYTHAVSQGHTQLPENMGPLMHVRRLTDDLFMAVSLLSARSEHYDFLLVHSIKRSSVCWWMEINSAVVPFPELDLVLVHARSNMAQAHNLRTGEMLYLHYMPATHSLQRIHRIIGPLYAVLTSSMCCLCEVRKGELVRWFYRSPAPAKLLCYVPGIDHVRETFRAYPTRIEFDKTNGSSVYINKFYQPALPRPKYLRLIAGCKWLLLRIGNLHS